VLFLRRGSAEKEVIKAAPGMLGTRVMGEEEPGTRDGKISRGSTLPS
jgi:hypothetical protein